MIWDFFRPWFRRRMKELKYVNEYIFVFDIVKLDSIYIYGLDWLNIDAVQVNN